MCLVLKQRFRVTVVTLSHWSGLSEMSEMVLDQMERQSDQRERGQMGWFEKP